MSANFLSWLGKFASGETCLFNVENSFLKLIFIDFFYFLIRSASDVVYFQGIKDETISAQKFKEKIHLLPILTGLEGSRSVEDGCTSWQP